MMAWRPPRRVAQAHQFGTRGAPLAQATGLAASASARSFGGFLGVYAGANCTLAAARGKADIWNVIASGAAAGTFGTLKTRNPAFIAGSAAVGAAHYATNFFSPPLFLSFFPACTCNTKACSGNRASLARVREFAYSRAPIHNPHPL